MRGGGFVRRNPDARNPIEDGVDGRTLAWNTSTRHSSISGSYYFQSQRTNSALKCSNQHRSGPIHRLTRLNGRRLKGNRVSIEWMLITDERRGWLYSLTCYCQQDLLSGCSQLVRLNKLNNNPRPVQFKSRPLPQLVAMDTLPIANKMLNIVDRSIGCISCIHCDWFLFLLISSGAADVTPPQPTEWWMTYCPLAINDCSRIFFR